MNNYKILCASPILAQRMKFLGYTVEKCDPIGRGEKTFQAYLIYGNEEMLIAMRREGIAVGADTSEIDAALNRIGITMN